MGTEIPSPRSSRTVLARLDRPGERRAEWTMSLVVAVIECALTVVSEDEEGEEGGALSRGLQYQGVNCPFAC